MLLKYIHLERFGTDEVDGINIGKCHIFPKIDGTNASVWLEDGVMCFGSRNRQITPEDDNGGFANWAKDKVFLKLLLDSLPEGSRVFGEWLIPHSLKTYRADAWRRFWVFDVLLPSGDFMHYDEYMPLCKKHNVDFIPCVCVSNNPTYEVLSKETEKNKFLIEENSGVGEGVVIKQYGWKNRFQRTTWAKLVTNSFKDKHITEMGGSVINIKMIEEEIAEEFITDHMVEKVIAKIRNEKGAFLSSNIPQLLGMVYHDLVSEELWQAIKQHKNPKIDFKTLNHCAINRIKTIKPELFGVKAA
jgi:hypothetical protein